MKSRTKLAALITALCSLAAPVAAAEPDRYAEGQVWEYRTRPGEEASILKIQKIETTGGYAKFGPVFHISVIGVRFAKPGIQPVLPHSPVSRETLDASVTRLSTRTDAFPARDEVETGIAEWRRAKGGVFTIPVSQIVDVIDATLGKGDGS